jgi:hypothetical protein
MTIGARKDLSGLLALEAARVAMTSRRNGNLKVKLQRGVIIAKYFNKTKLNK